MSSARLSPSSVSPSSGSGSRPSGLRRWAVASLVANIGIVVTGGAVRLTASGLGCPTWPRCDADSFVPTGEMGVHGVIEFGNRLLTFVLVAIAVGTLVSAFRCRDADGAPRPDLRRPAVALALGIPAQAVIGGVVVLTNLNPWLVGWHFLLSMVLIGGCVVLLRRTGPPPPAEPRLLRSLTMATLVAVGAVAWLGTVVTASGPHAGDADAPRTGLDLALVAQAHADAVFLLVGLTIAVVIAAVTTEASGWLRRAAVTLAVVEAVQAVVGYGQWFAGLPPLLVGVHLLGAGLTVAAGVDLAAAAGWWVRPQPPETTGDAGGDVSAGSPRPRRARRPVAADRR